MREIARPVVRAMSFACAALALAGLAFAMAIGSSGTVLAQQQSRPQQQGPCNHLPLPLPTAELVRIPAQRVIRIEPDANTRLLD